MKIKKSNKTVTASSLVADGAIVDNKVEACEHIKSAISLLSQCAIEKPDSTKVIEESIANLGVILLDLCD
jgi:hypothetical protein